LQEDAQLRPEQAENYLREVREEHLAAERSASGMIHLDTNHLIGLMVKGVAASDRGG
jgi:hypothetical protein